MNIDLFKKIQSGGLSFSSPSIGVGNQAISAVNQADNALSPLESLGVVNPGILSSTRQLLSSTNGSLLGNVSQITAMSNDTLRLSSMAQQANKLDALTNQVPSSCFNTEALFATVNGACDEFFNAIGDAANSIIEKVAAYFSGSMSSSALESFLSGVAEIFKSALSSIADRFSAEQSFLTDMKNKLMASSLAQSIEALWKNDCTRAALDMTLPDNIKALL
ncbi:DUF7217 family protein [Shewanella baltica]|uniref:DUF7217 family protein n=1 Tax=Shewanella baltica TaxID=62322 RepID=UPI00217E7DCB|nr:hypothetical protein [Shewanella baltica]MCS6257465.1 hypothetical protein [Shewanella baltica]MCS6272673.1 hypothetical protein [Shewanella baltica]